ncbi:hypothetical protein LWI29_002488 [Acer saccharum]|uniref:Myb-like domain-containing protein n=1 Tax=Acer saccharum TaxID=4024 RepID=A0AA39VK22_ACESA|nr:hypothetical protein LWI29_002488 [Acer saccharum]KAK1568853.1 hypothetical protein Q3G72_029743 [Acer saccharum]
MAASANPVGNNQEGSSSAAAAAQKSTANGVSVNSSSNGGNSSGADCLQTTAALRHNSGISLDWTPEEQSTLEELLSKYASDQMLVRYAKIAMQLKDKTVRDVALRCRWMNKKENGKRRKEDHNSARKSKDRKEKATDSSAKSSSHLSTRPNGPSYAPPMIPMDTDDGISYTAIGGVTGELLEQNAQMFQQISANFAAFQIRENIDLLRQARDNIFAVLNDLNDMPEIMKQMPPLPVKVNDEIANNILPRTSHQMNS